MKWDEICLFPKGSVEIPHSRSLVACFYQIITICSSQAGLVVICLVTHLWLTDSVHSHQF